MDESEQKFINGCRAKKGKVNVLDNTIECELDGITLVKKRKNPNILEE